MASCSFYMKRVTLTIISFVRHWRVKISFLSMKIISWIMHSSIKWWTSFQFGNCCCSNHLKITWQCVVYRDLRLSINACTVLYSDLHDFFLCCCWCCCCRYLLFRLWSDVLSLMTFIHTICFFFSCPEIRSNVLFSPWPMAHELNVICWWTPFCPKWKGQRQFIITSFVLMRCVLIWWSIDVDILFDALNSWTDILETVDWTLNTEHLFLFLFFCFCLVQRLRTEPSSQCR